MSKRSSSSSTPWSAAATLKALTDIPAPLKTEEQAEALHQAIATLQDAPSSAAVKPIRTAASDQIVRIVDTTVTSAAAGKRFSDQLLFALKLAALLGTREGAEAIVRAVRRPLDPDGYMWTTVLGSIGEGHPLASFVFGALAKPLPEKFVGICLLDAANEACREHGLRKHPFDSREGAARLAKLLGSTRADQSSYAVSACAALPFIAPARRKPLLALARRHKDPAIRMEVAWAMARMNDKAGLKDLIDSCLNPNSSAQACRYLQELKKSKLIPKAAREPDFAALSEMCDWLAHPNEVGSPPDHIELLDKRKLYWPPTRDERWMRLFKYTYNKSRDNDKIVGVGLVGSITFSLFDEAKPSMTPEMLYGLHCAWELEGSGDPRAPRKRTPAAGWKLIQQRA